MLFQHHFADWNFWHSLLQLFSGLQSRTPVEQNHMMVQ